MLTRMSAGNFPLPTDPTAAMGQMQSQINQLLDYVRRIVGDSGNSDIPVELRSKGLLSEIREDQTAFFAEQRDWKVAQDATNDKASEERGELRVNQERIVARLEKLENQRSRTYRLWVYLVTWITKKDDGVSVAVVKVAGMITGIGAILVVFGSFTKNVMPYVVHGLVHAFEKYK
jgi:hypothetical protein